MKYWKDEEVRKKIFIGTALIINFIIIFNVSFIWEMLTTLFEVFFPFILGLGIAFVLNVPMNAIEKRIFKNREKYGAPKWDTIRRAIALVVTILFAIVVVTLIMSIFIPQIVDTFTQLVQSIPSGVKKLTAWAESKFADQPKVLNTINHFAGEWQNFLQTLTDYLKDYMSVIVQGGINAVTSIVSVVVTSILGFVFSIYLLAQKETLCKNLKKVSYAFFGKKNADGVGNIAKVTSQTFANFIAGQCTEAIIICGIFSVATTLLGIPYALLISVLIAVMSLIPIVGSFIACVFGALLILTEDPGKALVFVIAFIVLIQIESNLIYPRVVGNQVGLPGIWVLLSVTVGGSLFGIIGMVIFIPVVSVIYALFRTYVYKRLSQDELLDEFDLTADEVLDAETIKKMDKKAEKKAQESLKKLEQQAIVQQASQASQPSQIIQPNQPVQNNTDILDKK